MVELINKLATILGMGEGELLKLARIEAQDGALVAIDFLPIEAQHQLIKSLCWMRDADCELDRAAYVAYDP